MQPFVDFGSDFVIAIVMSNAWLELGLADATKLQECIGVARSIAQHLPQRTVVEYDVGWHIVFLCQAPPTFA